MLLEQFKAFVKYVQETNEANYEAYLKDNKGTEKTLADYASEVGDLELFIYIKAPKQSDDTDYYYLELDTVNELVILPDSTQDMVMFKDSTDIYCLKLAEIYHMATT